MVQFQAGQAPTADELTSLVPGYVLQGTQQEVSESTTLVDSDIAIPIDGLCEVRLSVRYHPQGGGFRWAWRATGSVDMASRDIVAAGESTTGAGVHDIQEMQFRQIVTLDQEHAVVGVSGATSHMVNERCIVSGEGELIFQFAQETSDVGATQLRDPSFATVQPLREL